eukprot:TRINITY_DN2771_c0_g1_i1.p1 TRINITY_DN2771_c0_g1~~TRINITY_DN2771_c0_g1_i1.p1  ORF type:complete len:402 (-),score=103.95 TRINITY_DN2771_c0_g1_i1:53-1258(-)
MKKIMMHQNANKFNKMKTPYFKYNQMTSIQNLITRKYCNDSDTHETYKNPNAKKQRTVKTFPRSTWEAFDVKRRNQDLLIRTFNKDYRIAFIFNTNTAKKAQEKHNLNGESALLLAKTMSAASLIASGLKGEERVQVIGTGKGEVKVLYGEALQLGEVRGYLHRDTHDTGVWIDEKARVDSPLRDGIMTVKKYLYGNTEAIESYIHLQKGDIQSEFQEYYDMSEQIPAFVNLFSSLDRNGVIKFSGGFVLEAFPNSPDITMEKAKQSFQFLKSIEEQFFVDEKTPYQILTGWFPEIYEYDRNDTNKINTTPITFYCRCSREAFRNKLASLGERTVKEWRQDKDNDFTCQFCNETYPFTDTDFDAALEIIKKGTIDLSDGGSGKTKEAILEETQEQLDNINK